VYKFAGSTAVIYSAVLCVNSVALLSCCVCDRERKQDVARNSGVLLWLVLLAVNGRELSLRLSAQQLLKVTLHPY
jgi:hypothetical protein